MKIISVSILLITIVFSYVQCEQMTFDEFIIKFKKPYQSETIEYQEKKIIFEHNLENLRQKGCQTCGVTKFFDRSPKQFESKILTLELSENHTSDKFPDDAKQVYKVGAPRQIDWRKRKVVTSIKEQGDCGSCWAFTSVALGESSLILKGLAEIDVDLSEQYLLKCTEQGDCRGGFIQKGIDQMIQSGLPDDEDYRYAPYKNQNALCFTPFTTTISQKPRLSFFDITDNQIKDLLTMGPIAVAISSIDWQFYVKGIWKCKRNDPINHAVLLVGYTSNAWIIKNQWGTDWGENGYIYISMNEGENCKINTAVHMLKESYLGCLFVLCCMAIVLYLG